MAYSSVIILAFAALFDAAWPFAVWRRWPEFIYEKKRDSRLTWLWLTALGIPRTQSNCVRFLQICCFTGMVLVTSLSVFAVYLTRGQ